MLGLTTVLFNSCNEDDTPLPNVTENPDPNTPTNPTEPNITVTDIKLNRSALYLAVGANLTKSIALVAILTPSDATPTVIWKSYNETVASVNNQGTISVNTSAPGTALIEARVGDKSATCTVVVKNVPENGELINGVIWAKSNVDAPRTFAATPESHGKFYKYSRDCAWQTTGGAPKSSCGYAWTYSTNVGWDSGQQDPSPSGWRVPTHEELKTLVDTTKVDQVWDDSKKGLFFTDKISGANIFLPAVGLLDGAGMLSSQGKNCYYWSSTQKIGSSDGYNLIRTSNSGIAIIGSSSYFAFSVRPVAK